ncbi:MAG: adenylate/guanylate cyclase domain-containing protein [Actinomycetota bacterium]
MIPPETKFAQMGDINVAYQSFGSGPVDIVYVSNWVWAVDLIWDFPSVEFLESFGQMGRTIQFDMPGTGSSDPLPSSGLGTLEEWMDTVGVVLDAEGVERATLIGQDFGGPMAMLFAAAHPERVSSLILIGTTARLYAAPDYPVGYPLETRDSGIEWWERIWGTGQQLRLTAPSLADDENIRLMARYERLAIPRGEIRRVFSLIADLDVRHVLSSIHVPTLVLHRKEDRWLSNAHGRYLAENIPGARYVELPGMDHMPWSGDFDPIINEIRDFLGVAEREGPDVHDRILATVLFTDIVSSTERAADLGDRRWGDLLDRHDSMVRSELERWKGREVKTTGDGFLATFDGPGKAISAATSIRRGARRLGIDIRAGLHVGEVELRGEDIGGLAVHAAARIMSCADPGEVLTSSTVKDLVIGSETRFDDRGARELKGVPGEWRLFAVGAA